MKKLSIVLGENEACVNMEFEDGIAAAIFKDACDKMFGGKYGLESSEVFKSHHGHCCGDNNASAHAGEISEIDCAEVSEDIPTNEEVAMSLDELVDMAISTSSEETIDDRMVYLPEDRASIVLLKCDSCGGKFFSRTRYGESAICRCGHSIDVNGLFITAEYKCKKCSKFFMFYADKSVDRYSARCNDCGNEIKLRFDESRYSLNNY